MEMSEEKIIEGGTQEEVEHKRDEAEAEQDEKEEMQEQRKGKKRQRKKNAPPLAHVPLQPIGLFESCFLERHGTPRQGLLVPSSRGRLTLRRYGAHARHLRSSMH
jgi:hypothetical protein